MLDDSHGVGLVYMPQGNIGDALCTKTIGRPCIPNNLIQSGYFNASKPATLDVPEWKENSNFAIAETADEKLREKVKADAGFGKL